MFSRICERRRHASSLAFGARVRREDEAGFALADGPLTARVGLRQTLTYIGNWYHVMSFCHLSPEKRKCQGQKKKLVHIAGKKNMNADISEGDARKKNRALKTKYSMSLMWFVINAK
jgi:hypothetical protein